MSYFSGALPVSPSQVELHCLKLYRPFAESEDCVVKLRSGPGERRGRHQVQELLQGQWWLLHPSWCHWRAWERGRVASHAEPLGQGWGVLVQSLPVAACNSGFEQSGFFLPLCHHGDQHHSASAEWVLTDGYINWLVCGCWAEPSLCLSIS